MCAPVSATATAVAAALGILVFNSCIPHMHFELLCTDCRQRQRRDATLLKGISGEWQRRQEAYAHALVANCRRRVVLFLKGNVILSMPPHYVKCWQ